MNEDLIEWYTNLPKEVIPANVKEFCSVLPFSNLSSVNIDFRDSGADEFLESLLLDDSLLIVNKNCEVNVNYDSVAYVDHLVEDPNVDVNKRYVFYLNGVDSTTGEIISQKYFNDLRSKFKNSIFVLNDTDGMFIVPRNYSLFNYVVFHCDKMLKEHKDIILKVDNDLDNEIKVDLITRICNIKSNVKKTLYFKNFMKSIFSDLLHSRLCKTCFNSANHIFSVQLNITTNISDKLPKPFQFIQNNDGFFIRLDVYDILDYNELELKELFTQFENFVKYCSIINQYNF